MTGRFALSLMLLAAPLAAQPRPNFSGTWKLDESAGPSSATGAHNVVFQIKHKEPAFSYFATGRRSSNDTFQESFRFTTDGRQPDPATVGIAGMWEGDALALHYMRGGKEMAKITLRLSSDGKRMYRTGQVGGRQIREVYDKQ
ncbi:MAG: hypothetical protein ABSC08_07740 [Bryobacteraceae bacterium]